MRNRSKTWILIAIIFLAAIILGFLFRSAPVSLDAETTKVATLEERPHTFAAILEDILYVPAHGMLPGGMEPSALSYSDAEQLFICRYEDGAGSWIETGISNGAINGYEFTGAAEIDGRNISSYSAPGGDTLLAYHADSTNYFVRGSLSGDDLKPIIAEYVRFVIDQDLV